MKIPDFHVSNVFIDGTIFVDNLDLLEIIISSLVSQYIDQEISAEDLILKFTVPIVNADASEAVQKEQIKAQLPAAQKALPVETQNLIAEVLLASPPAKVEIKYAIDPVTGLVDTSKPKTIEVSAKEELNEDGTPVINQVTQKPVGYDTVVSTFSQDADDTATRVTFEIEQSAVIEEGTDDVVIAAGLYLPRPQSASRKNTIVQRSVESTVRKVVSRMNKTSEGVYPAIASVMESSYDIELTNLGKMLNTFYVFFVDVTNESDGLKWSFVYPVQGQGNTIVYNYASLDVPDTITTTVGVTINADYLRKPNVFDITFGDAASGESFKTSVDLNPPPATSSNPQPVATIIPFDEPGTPFIVINGGDKVNIKDVQKVFDPPDPTPTPSPTITITHPTPTPSISFTPTTTIHPTPTPTMTVTPSPTTTGTQDITTLFNFTQNGADVDVSLNTNQMNIEGTTEDIAGFTLAFFVPSSMSATTGDGKVSLVDSFDNFEYRYATSNNTSNVLYITGYCSFIGSQEVHIDRLSNDGYMNVLRIKNTNVSNVSPVNPTFNNVVAISNREAKLWDLNMAYNASIRSGFYVSDMTSEYIMLHVDGSMFEEDASSFRLNLEGIVIESIEDSSEFNGWDISINSEKNEITATKGEGIAKMHKGDMRRMKLKYSEINGDIKIKEAYANEKKIESGYLIPEDVQFDNGIARIRTRHIKDSLLKSFLVMTKGDLGTVTASQLLIDDGWAVESKYNTRDGYTRVMGYSTTQAPRRFEDMDALFIYTKVVRTQRIASQFPGYAFVNALNANIATMANVLTGDDIIDGMSRFTWLLDHIADKSKIPTGESLKEFFVKSDVTFDGRILVNDVVALKQYILGGLTYPDKRPLGVFEVKYTISGVSDVVFGQLSNNLQEISAAIESKIYEKSVATNDARNVSIVGTERTLSGDMNIYARVFWDSAGLYNNAIRNSNNMFEAVQYTSYSLAPEKARPEGVVAVEHSGGTSFTVYGYGLSEISYSTYYTSVSKTISGLSTIAYSHDITIPDGDLVSGFDVLYVTGSGGRTVATAVSEIPTPTVSATPSTTHTVTPTITKSPVPTPTMTVTITDGSELQEPPSNAIDPEKPFGDVNHLNPPIGPIDEKSVAWEGKLLNDTNTGYITIGSNDVLCIMNGDDPQNLIPIQYMKETNDNFTKNLYHYDQTVFNMVFKLLRYDERKIYDLVHNSGIVGGQASFTQFKYATSIGTNYFNLGTSVDVTFSGDPVTVNPVPTPTATVSITPTPTISMTYTPTVTITDGSEKQEPPSIDPEKPFGDVNHLNPPIGPIDEKSVAWEGKLLNDTNTGYITIGSNDVLCIMNGDDPQNLIPIQYMKETNDNFTKNLYHYDQTVFNMVFKLLRYDERKIYDLVHNSGIVGGQASFTQFKYATSIGTNYFNLGTSVDVTYATQRVMTINSSLMSNRVANSVTSASGSFTADDDGYKWLSFRYIPDDRTVVGLFQQFSELKLNTTVIGQQSSSIYSAGLFGGASWSDPSFPIEYSKMYKIKNIGGVTYDFTDTTKYTSNRIDCVDGYNWIGYLSTKSVTVSELNMDILGIIFIGQVGSTKYSAGLFGGASWSDPNFTFNPNEGFLVYVPEDSSKKYIEWPQADPPVSNGPQSSGSPTFDIINIGTPTNGWTSFDISIDTNTLNQYEFHTDNSTTSPSRASVDRKGDSEESDTNVVLSTDKRYQLIRSIELVFKDHVYTSNSLTNDDVITIDRKSENRLGPEHDNMYIYCARTTVSDVKETRVMIVNAHNEITTGLLDIPRIFYTQSGLDINSLIDWTKSYIGSTSIYKAEWNPLLADGATPAYEQTKYTSSTGDTIKDFYWKKKDDAIKASYTPEQGLFLRYSLDSGLIIIPGGISNESFTAPGGLSSRLVIDDMYIFGNVDGNVDGNVEEY